MSKYFLLPFSSPPCSIKGKTTRITHKHSVFFFFFPKWWLASSFPCRLFLICRLIPLPYEPPKKQRHHFIDKGPYSHSYGFSSSHVWMWELEHKEGWTPKNWCFQTVLLQKTLESPLDCKEIKPVHPKGNESWIHIGRTDSGYEVPIVCSPVAKSWLIEKDPGAGKDWGQEEKRETEDKVIGWHHLLNGPKCEQTLGDSEGQGGLACCGPWSFKESDTDEWLNNSLILCCHCSWPSMRVFSWVSDMYLWKDLCLHFTWKSQKDGEFLVVYFRAGQEDRIGRVIICIIYQGKKS